MTRLVIKVPGDIVNDSDGKDTSTSDVINGEEASDADLRDEELPSQPKVAPEQTSAKATERHRKRLLKVPGRGCLAQSEIRLPTAGAEP